jgi:calcium/calmodulin-dependent protein kinase I
VRAIFLNLRLNNAFVQSAKHLHSPEEQLHSLAGSFGYVAPEVLNKQGHGKAVDIWSTG